VHLHCPVPGQHVVFAAAERCWLTSACEHRNTQSLFCKAPTGCSVTCSSSPQAEVLPFLLQLLPIAPITAVFLMHLSHQSALNASTFPKAHAECFSLLAPVLMCSQNLLIVLRSATQRPVTGTGAAPHTPAAAAPCATQCSVTTLQELQ